MYNQRGLIGGDSPLSPAGEAYARALPAVLASRVPPADDATGAPAVPVCVWTSTLRRTIQTAAHLPFAKLRWKALDEIDAGVCDGLTYEEISARHPQEALARSRDKLRYRYPRGESYLDLVQRIEPVIAEIERDGGRSVCVVAHQAVLRVVLGYILACPQADVPRISTPLHTLIELTPRPDGTMSVAYIPVAIQVQSAGGRVAGAGGAGKVVGEAAAGAVGAAAAAGAVGAAAAAAAGHASPFGALAGGADGGKGAGAAAAAAAAADAAPQRDAGGAAAAGAPAGARRAAPSPQHAGTARATGGLAAHASSSHSSPTLSTQAGGGGGLPLSAAAQNAAASAAAAAAARGSSRRAPPPASASSAGGADEDADDCTGLSRHASCSSAATFAFYTKQSSGEAAAPLPEEKEAPPRL